MKVALLFLPVYLTGIASGLPHGNPSRLVARAGPDEEIMEFLLPVPAADTLEDLPIPFLPDPSADTLPADDRPSLTRRDPPTGGKPKAIGWLPDGKDNGGDKNNNTKNNNNNNEDDDDDDDDDERDKSLFATIYRKFNKLKHYLDRLRNLQDGLEEVFNEAKKVPGVVDDLADKFEVVINNIKEILKAFDILEEDVESAGEAKVGKKKADAKAKLKKDVKAAHKVVGTKDKPFNGLKDNMNAALESISGHITSLGDVAGLADDITTKMGRFRDVAVNFLEVIENPAGFLGKALGTLSPRDEAELELLVKRAMLS